MTKDDFVHVSFDLNKEVYDEVHEQAKKKDMDVNTYVLRILKAFYGKQHDRK